MKTRNMITATIAIIAGAITIWRFGTRTFGILSGVNVAIIIAIGGLFVGRILDNREDERKGFAVKDERSILVEAKSGRAAFQIGNYILLALVYYEFLSDNWLPTPTIGSPGVLLIGLLAQIAVYFVSMRHYWKHTQ